MINPSCVVFYQSRACESARTTKQASQNYFLKVSQDCFLSYFFDRMYFIYFTRELRKQERIAKRRARRFAPICQHCLALLSKENVAYYMRVEAASTERGLYTEH